MHALAREAPSRGGEAVKVCPGQLPVQSGTIQGTETIDTTNGARQNTFCKRTMGESARGCATLNLGIVGLVEIPFALALSLRSRFTYWK